MSALPIPVPNEAIAEFCRRNRIRKLSLFGSVLTPRFGPDSDVDFLVEFEPGTPVSYFDLVGMEMELSEVIGRKVDLRAAEELSRYFRDRVVASAVPQYERHRSRPPPAHARKGARGARATATTLVAGTATDLLNVGILLATSL